MDTKPVTISINGILGEASVSGYGVELRGPWASHTGYRSMMETKGKDFSEAALYEVAKAQYDEQKGYAFVVGDENRDHGWKKIMVFQDRIEIRLPSWHKGIVAKALESYGMQLDCKWNMRWVFPASSVEMDVVRAVFAPILRAGTRFADESELTKQIDVAARESGYAFRSPLQQGEAQCSLF